MHRIDNTTASTTLPTPKAAGPAGFFTAGSIGGQSATIVEADWLNMVQEELLAILAADGLAPVKTTNNQVITAILDLMRKNTRQRLTGALDIYVDTTGDDTANDGLTADTPFATIQAAWDFIMATLDCGNQVITVHIAHGTYAPVACIGMPMGGGQVIFSGDTANPDLVIIHSDTPNVSAVSARDTLINVEGLRLESSGDQLSRGLISYNSTVGVLGPVSFGPCTGAQMESANGGTIVIDADYSINGGATYHIVSANNGTFTQPAVPTPGTITVTLVGTPNFSVAFAGAYQGGVVFLLPATFVWSGGATGQRYSGGGGGQFAVSGGGANYFPGSIAGLVDAASFSAYQG